MPKPYERKTDRGSWSEESMKNAVDAVLGGSMGYLKASKQFSVPKTTLERKVKFAREKVGTGGQSYGNLKVPLGPRQPVFSKAEEEELCSYILDMESRLFGITIKDLKALAYSLAVKNNKPHPFNPDTEEAGKDFVKGFLARHPELSIRKPESTSAARAAGFNKQAVDQFYNLLGKIYDENDITPDRIYNCDETGVSVVPKTKSKIIAKKGRKQVGAITSAERGTTVTIEICFSASGQYMPPMMIFPRKKMDPQLMLHAAPGAWGVCSDSGWMTAKLFLEWFKKFIEFSGAKIDRKVLLLLDGHSTHTQNIDVINEARANGVIILCFPPHTTHRLQVADVAYMKPLSTYYDQQITAWLRNHTGMVVTVRQIAEIFGKAFIQASTMATAVNGFRKCGIWPYDPTVFTDSDFAPSLTTEIPLQVTRPHGSPSLISQPQLESGLPSLVPQTQPDGGSPSLVPQPQPESGGSPSLIPQPQPESGGSSSMIPQPQPESGGSPSLIPQPQPESGGSSSMIPQPQPQSGGSPAPIIVPLPESGGTPALIPLPQPESGGTPSLIPQPQPESESPLPTPQSQPESQRLPTQTPQPHFEPQPGCSFWPITIPVPDRRPTTPEQSQFQKFSPKQLMPLPSTRITTRVTRKRGKTAIITSSPYKKNLEEAIQKKKCDEENKKRNKEKRELKKKQKQKPLNKTKKIKKSKAAIPPNSDSESDAENVPCLFCGGRYLDSGEGWAACSACGKWAHCSCAGVDDEDDEGTFTCEFCAQ